MSSKTSSSQTLEIALKRSRQASYRMAALPTEQKDRVLLSFADLIESESHALLAANAKDCQLQKNKLSPSLYQRLGLSHDRLDQLATGVRDVSRLHDPVGRVMTRTLLDDGLTLDQITVPLGVIAIIFESRPDVLPQILALALKSGNSIVLKGGSEARYSNRAFMRLVDKLNDQWDMPAGWATLLETRQDVHQLLAYDQLVDLVIPRGSSELVRTIMDSTRIPVLGHAEGVCHIFVEASANLDDAVQIVADAKAQYPAACNAVETLLVDAPAASAFLPRLNAMAERRQICLKGCPRTRQTLEQIEPASEEDWSSEYGALTLAVKIVDGTAAAVAHINQYGSHHTDAILTEDREAAERFLQEVDSASVFHNASTRFADGFRFGLGAEIGISTARTHARGPVGLDGLVTYKFQLRGQGQTVTDYTSGKRSFLHRSLLPPAE